MISPLMATSDLTSRLLKSEARQVTMVTPADGPSLVTAPAGKWRWMSVPSRGSGLPVTVWGKGQQLAKAFKQQQAGHILTVGQLVALGVGSQPADGQVSRLLHDVSQLTGQGQLTVSLHTTGLHKHDLAAEGGPRQAHSHAGQGEPLGHLQHKRRRGNGGRRKDEPEGGRSCGRLLFTSMSKSGGPRMSFRAMWSITMGISGGVPFSEKARWE